MQKWEMKETFTFPKQLGNVQENSKIVVEPKWHEEISEDSVVVRGIYVVKGNIQFDHVAREDEIEEGIYIEHMDIEKDHGYFEYALPFSVDFPNDDIEAVSLRINDIKVEPNNGYCSCSWAVHCDVEKKVQAIVEVEEPAPVEEIVVEKPVEEVQPRLQAEKEVESTQMAQTVPHELDFLEQLADAYSRVQIQLKK
ncbi:alanine racemase [Solibacillus isronensis]|uniref:alanine racemase n=1 Tax=Solibacillus isronensis TaxID=412383 RepID=UPI00203AD095|nr:alanine racemase [Solibacillus isronensis]MCM3720672.1 alanine racemase [Solibacillus isronensis]